MDSISRPDTNVARLKGEPSARGLAQPAGLASCALSQASSALSSLESSQGISLAAPQLALGSLAQRLQQFAFPMQAFPPCKPSGDGHDMYKSPIGIIRVDIKIKTSHTLQDLPSSYSQSLRKLVPSIAGRSPSDLLQVSARSGCIRLVLDVASEDFRNRAVNAPSSSALATQLALETVEALELDPSQLTDGHEVVVQISGIVCTALWSSASNSWSCTVQSLSRLHPPAHQVPQILKVFAGETAADTTCRHQATKGIMLEVVLHLPAGLELTDGPDTASDLHPHTQAFNQAGATDVEIPVEGPELFRSAGKLQRPDQLAALGGRLLKCQASRGCAYDPDMGWPRSTDACEGTQQQQQQAGTGSPVHDSETGVRLLVSSNGVYWSAHVRQVKCVAQDAGQSQPYSAAASGGVLTKHVQLEVFPSLGGLPTALASQLASGHAQALLPVQVLKVELWDGPWLRDCATCVLDQKAVRAATSSMRLPNQTLVSTLNSGTAQQEPLVSQLVRSADACISPMPQPPAQQPLHMTSISSPNTGDLSSAIVMGTPATTSSSRASIPEPVKPPAYSNIFTQPASPAAAYEQMCLDSHLYAQDHTFLRDFGIFLGMITLDPSMPAVQLLRNELAVLGCPYDQATPLFTYMHQLSAFLTTAPPVPIDPLLVQLSKLGPALFVHAMERRLFKAARLLMDGMCTPVWALLHSRGDLSTAPPALSNFHRNRVLVALGKDDTHPHLCVYSVQLHDWLKDMETQELLQALTNRNVPAARQSLGWRAAAAMQRTSELLPHAQLLDTSGTEHHACLRSSHNLRDIICTRASMSSPDAQSVSNPSECLPGPALSSSSEDSGLPAGQPHASVAAQQLPTLDDTTPYADPETPAADCTANVSDLVSNSDQAPSPPAGWRAALPALLHGFSSPAQEDAFLYFTAYTYRSLTSAWMIAACALMLSPSIQYASAHKAYGYLLIDVLLALLPALPLFLFLVQHKWQQQVVPAEARRLGRRFEQLVLLLLGLWSGRNALCYLAPDAFCGRWEFCKTGDSLVGVLALSFWSICGTPYRLINLRWLGLLGALGYMGITRVQGCFSPVHVVVTSLAHVVYVSCLELQRRTQFLHLQHNHEQQDQAQVARKERSLQQTGGSDARGSSSHSAAAGHVHTHS